MHIKADDRELYKLERIFYRTIIIVYKFIINIKDKTIVKNQGGKYVY